MNTAEPLIAKIRSLFQRDLALENDFLRNENRILRGKFGRRVPLTDRDRRTLWDHWGYTRIAGELLKLCSP